MIFLRAKEKKGITLIALVITIIVLLILAGVTIAALSGDNGILTRAQEAKKQSEIASVKEQAKLDIANWVAEELKNGRDGILSNWEDIKNVLDTANPDEENRYYTEVTVEGVETPNGYLVPIEELYTNDSSEEETTSKTVEDLKAGERVYYDTGNISIGNQGIIECIVLYDSTSSYGVQIITADTLDTVTLGSKDSNTAINSYNNAITTLNTKAEEYLNEKDKKETPEIVTDARCVGSVPNNKTLESGNFKSEYDYMTAYSVKDEDNNYDSDYNQMEKLGITTSNSSYWIASRHIRSDAGHTYLDMHVMSSSGSLDYNALCSIGSGGDAYGDNPSNGIRCVFTLKFGIKAIKDYEENVYKLYT